MRTRLALLALILLLAPAASAQPGDPARATLTLDVQEGGAERMTLAFDGLRRLAQYNGICLPFGARESRVYDDLGELQYEAREEDGRRVLSFLARGEAVRIDMAREGPTDDTHPLYAGDVNFCVPSGARVETRVRVPEGHTLFFLSANGTLEGPREGRASSEGPMHLFYTYEAPLGARRPLTAFDEGPFRVFASTSLAPRAQEVARLADAPFRAALAEAGLEAPFDTLRVLFTPESPHAWEAGHYDGNGFVSVKESTLSGDATEGYPYSAVKILVHESFHAASFPYGKGPVEDTVAWWLEGTARHAERQVDVTMPNASRHCQRSATEARCWDFDDRIRRADLETGYDAGFVFDTDWEPSRPQSDDTRRFYYAYSEFVVGSWIAREGEARYRAAWDEITAAFRSGEGCPCGEGWLEGVLEDEDMFRPWADLHAADTAAFDARVKPFVKDEEGFQRALDEHADPLAGIPAAPAMALLALVGLAALARRRGLS